MSQRKIKTPKYNSSKRINTPGVSGLSGAIQLTALVTSLDPRTYVLRTDSLQLLLRPIANNDRRAAAAQCGARHEQDTGRKVTHVAIYEGVDIESIERVTGPSHLAEIQERLAAYLWCQVGTPGQPDVIFVNA